MPKEPEAGHVGRSGHALADDDLRRDAVERPHLVDGRPERCVRGLGPALPPTADDEPGTEPLREEQHVAGQRPALPEDAVGLHEADDGEPVFRLRVADRVAPGQNPARLAHLRGRAREHGGKRVP